MPAPQLTFSISRNRIGSAVGYDYIYVTFSSDIPYKEFVCRVTPSGGEYGRGVGRMVASFSSTPANTPRTFEVYESFLLYGEGEYRISLYAKSNDGGWNDNHAFIPSGSSGMLTSDGQKFLCMR